MILCIHLPAPSEIKRDGSLIGLSGYRPLALAAYLFVIGKPHSRQQVSDLLSEAVNFYIFKSEEVSNDEGS